MNGFGLLKGLCVVAIVAALGCMTLAAGARRKAMGEQQFEKDVIETSAGNLEITFVGHGTLMFRFKDMVCNRPGKPKTWSPCMWVTKTLVNLPKPTRAVVICLWVPSPQSKSISSFFLRNATADRPL